MTKAEDFAYQKYPQSKKGVLYDLARNSIIQGYHQAEKDLSDQTKMVVESTMEEMMVWLEENAFKYMEKQDTMFGAIKVFNSHKLVNDLKQAIKYD